MTIEKLRRITERIVANNALHARWLNTLSMMENTGARKISKYEDPHGVSLTILKHAAEEARHAYYLKKQIVKLTAVDFPDYSSDHLVVPVQSQQYLNQLDLESCRYLKNTLGLTGRAMKHGAYLLVTYAIEVRADEIYAVYQDVLTRHKSQVTVKSIIAEEEGHLREMRAMLQKFSPDWETHANHICAFEANLYNDWLTTIEQSLGA
jgi:rubrerythrin